jgi:uncharacterized protein (DUF2267 family)
MQAEEFLKKVRLRSGLENNEKARQVTDAVFQVLRARISHAGGDNVAQQFPKEIRNLWESGPLEHVLRSFTGVEHMNLGKFLGHVQNLAHFADAAEAEVATRAVFMTLREQITHGAEEAISNQLPEDIREFWWMSSPPKEEKEQPEGRYGSEEIGPAATSVFRSDEQISHDIQGMLEVSDEVDADKIDIHVRQGMVTLRGVVVTSDEWEAAERLAKRALGVVEVHNELTVVESL